MKTYWPQKTTVIDHQKEINKIVDNTKLDKGKLRKI